MTREEMDFIGGMNMCDEISNEAYKKIMCHCEEQENVLDKIRAEIEKLPKTYPFVNHLDKYVKEDDVKKIIDKYTAVSAHDVAQEIVKNGGIVDL